MPEPAEAHTLESLGEPLGARRAVGEPVEAAHDASPTEAHEAHALPLAGTPSQRVPGGDVEVHAPRLRAIEHEPAIHLEERVVRAHEDRVIGRVLDVDLR